MTHPVGLDADSTRSLGTPRIPLVILDIVNGLLFELTSVILPITFNMVGFLDGPLPNPCAVENYDVQY